MRCSLIPGKSAPERFCEPFWHRALYGMNDQVSVVVVLFASHRELLGKSRISLSVPEGSSVEALYDELAQREPRLQELRPFTTFAVNREVVDPSTDPARGR